MPQFDATTFPSQLFWLAITFGMLCLYMRLYILPRYRQLFQTRTRVEAYNIEAARLLEDEANMIKQRSEDTLGAVRQDFAGRLQAQHAKLRSKHEADVVEKIQQERQHLTVFKAQLDSKMQTIARPSTSDAAAIVAPLRRVLGLGEGIGTTKKLKKVGQDA